MAKIVLAIKQAAIFAQLLGNEEMYKIDGKAISLFITGIICDILKKNARMFVVLGNYLLKKRELLFTSKMSYKTSV